MKTSIRQHQPLRVPSGWKDQDRALVIQLEQLLDEVYTLISKANAEIKEINTEVDGKANKVSGATDGNFAALDSNGDLTDSGHKHSDYALKSDAVTSVDYDSTNKKVTKTINGATTDVVAVSTIKSALGSFTWGALAGQ